MVRKRTPAVVAMPDTIAPMLCKPSTTLPGNAEYLFEIKYDGYRIVAFVQKTGVRLASREHQNYTKKYPAVVQELAGLEHEVVLDGEIVAYVKGKMDFNALQRYRPGKMTLKYHVFDLLWMDGHDLTGMPLTERKELLALLLKDQEVVSYVESFDDGEALLERMKSEHMEGVIAKKRNSVYQPGTRTDLWQKIKITKRNEFVIVGYTESDTTTRFRSLLFGAYNQQGKLEYVHHSGGGWSSAEGKTLFAWLQKHEVKRKPFGNTAVTETRQHYVRPLLVAEFEISGKYTRSGEIRHPAIYKGLRPDKRPKEVVYEKPAAEMEEIVVEPAGTDTGPATKTSEASVAGRSLRSKKERKYLNKDSNWKRVDQLLVTTTTPFELPHCRVELHDIEQEIWKGVAKGDLFVYYNELSATILPHITDRPQSLNLILDGPERPPTFIKDMEHRQPACAKVFTDKRRVANKNKRGIIDYLVCNNTETLLWMIDLHCIDINPWPSRWQTPDEPDFIWIDLDPSKQGSDWEEKGFKKAVTCALAAKEVLDSMGLLSFVKTSGKTGMHIYIPCTSLTHQQTRLVAEHICDRILPSVKSIATRSVDKSSRGDKVYLDAGQNTYTHTLAAPYSVRPYHQPLVSTPLHWKEVGDRLDRWAFTMDVVKKRLAAKGDLFAGAIEQKNAIRNTKKIRRVMGDIL